MLSVGDLIATLARGSDIRVDIYPDNSTACLLRALLADNTTREILQSVNDASNEYNWCSITFGPPPSTTLWLSASLHTLLHGSTLFRQLVAAGPGRIKSGPAAMGRWSRFRRTRVDLSELRLRTVSYTLLSIPGT